ncbi:MAG TPA: DUF4249 domain-containing protein [Bacteroides sp.]|nr:DUF4249 domain-containing protein [Bacteroides sp.]
MRVIKYLLTGSLVIFAVSCVDPFQPDIDETEGTLVVSGRITDRPGAHFVEVSRSSRLAEPEFIPLEGCVVRVEETGGMVATFTEDSPGRYRADLDGEFLGLNRAYRLIINTPDGEQYESTYDSLLSCPEPENLYYEEVSQASTAEGDTYYGIQFYVDVKGGEKDSRNIMWKLQETYEYHANFLIGAIWDGVVFNEFEYPTDSLYICYKTLNIPEIHAASTAHLTTNELTRFPLNFVSNQSPRLKHKFSLLISQHSLSGEAYRFWEQTRVQLTETGSFYETQPSTVPGNICNVHDETEQVLGYFYASQVKEKRITFRCRFGFRTPAPAYCETDTIASPHLLGEFWESYPYYMYSLAPMGLGPPYATAEQRCFDCRLSGGTIVPPDFWYEDE